MVKKFQQVGRNDREAGRTNEVIIMLTPSPNAEQRQNQTLGKATT